MKKYMVTRGQRFFIGIGIFVTSMNSDLSDTKDFSRDIFIIILCCIDDESSMEGLFHFFLLLDTNKSNIL